MRRIQVIIKNSCTTEIKLAQLYDTSSIDMSSCRPRYS
jgi:hypothetical protein